MALTDREDNAANSISAKSNPSCQSSASLEMIRLDSQRRHKQNAESEPHAESLA